MERIPFSADLAIAGTGILAAVSVGDITAVTTAGSAAFFLVCKGIVLVIRELNKGKSKRNSRPY